MTGTCMCGCPKRSGDFEGMCGCPAQDVCPCLPGCSYCDDRNVPAPWAATDPQTAADAAAAELTAWLDGRDANDQLGRDLRTLLVDRKRLVAELEQANAATAEQRAETYWLVERGEEMRDALTVAAELIDRLAKSTPCDIDHNGHCGPHRVREAPLPCPHPLGRRFVEAWRAVQSEAAEKGPQSPAEDPAPSPRPTPGG